MGSKLNRTRRAQKETRGKKNEGILLFPSSIFRPRPNFFSRFQPSELLEQATSEEEARFYTDDNVTTKYQDSFQINGAGAYNSLPSNIRAVKYFNKFKSLTKRYFKSQAAIPWIPSIVVCLRTFSARVSFHNSFVLIT